MPHLFDPIAFRDLTLRNRVVVSPMCEYSSEDGFANDWHLVHLGHGRSAARPGVHRSDRRRPPTAASARRTWDLAGRARRHLARIVDFVQGQGSAAGIQLAHAGRKAQHERPWERRRPGPAGRGRLAARRADGRAVRRQLSRARGRSTPPTSRRSSTRSATPPRAPASAGFDVVEIHARARLSDPRVPLAARQPPHRRVRRIVRQPHPAVPRGRRRRPRRSWPERLPLFVRLSCTDWVEGGWDIEQSVELARRLRTRGVDLIDCSSGGDRRRRRQIPVGPGYQVPFAERIRRDADIATGAVGLITTPAQAEAIVGERQADCVLLARELLRDPYWPLRAAARARTTGDVAVAVPARRTSWRRRTTRQELKGRLQPPAPIHPFASAARTLPSASTPSMSSSPDADHEVDVDRAAVAAGRARSPLRSSSRRLAA